MKKLLIIALLVLAIFPLTFKTQAGSLDGVPYDTYTEDSNHNLIPSQTAYIPFASYTVFGDYELNRPEDIYLDHHNNLYIADSGNNRILVINQNMTDIRVIGETILDNPTGVYVDQNDLIYVADFDAEKVIIFNQAGNVLSEITKPDVPMYGPTTAFRPSKIDGDASGNIYIVSEGTNQGLVQLDNTGAFLGFFGANPTEPDLRVIILESIFSDEIVDNFIKVIPQTMSDVTVDLDNRVYTVTRGSEGNAIKKLNISGINRLPTDMADGLTMSAITIGPIGNIYTVGDEGYVREYDADGNLLFQFGGRDNRTYQNGLFNTPSGIAVDDNYNLYILDRAKSELQIFIQTDYASVVHVAVDLYQKGYYLDSKEPWEYVLANNSLYDLAHQGIGQALLKEKNYREAMESFELAGYREGYSDAFWEVRNEWLVNNLPIFFIVILGLTAFSYIYKLIYKRRFITIFTNVKQKAMNIQTIKEISHIGTMIKNPFDGFYEIKREHKISIKIATLLYLVLFLESLFAIFFEGTSFNTHELSTISLLDQIIKFLAPIFLFVIANYLVGAVSSGEGKLKDIYIATIYALSPLIIFWPIVILLSRGMTLNEVFIYEAMMFAIVAWSGFLLFFMIKDIHNYSIKQTILSIVITLFAITMMVVSFILFSSLAEQALNFITELFREVFLRG
ncbi:YIP1 family protein [Candidatus Izemoplasma sp. B36]|uniref:YIP1 family protein n=1 Tax=Candidatus Izemoplasma sp. B36 TaxID=3242468 RepID=UPI0035581FFA